MTVLVRKEEGTISHSSGDEDDKLPVGEEHTGDLRSGLAHKLLPLFSQEQEKSSTNSIFIDGLRVRNPTLVVINRDGSTTPISTKATGENEEEQLDLDKPPLSGHYAFVGDIDLFGFIQSKLYIYQGLPTLEFPYAETVHPNQKSVSLGTFIPELKGSPLDAIILENPHFTFSEYSFSRTELPGLRFETDVLFQGVLEPIADVFRDFFGQPNPALHVSTYLGGYRNWKRPIAPSSFVLRGSLAQCSLKVADILEFTTIGVEISAMKVSSLDGRTEWKMGFGFFGKLNLTVPGSVVPLQVEYLLNDFSGTYTLFLELTDEEWVDVFGVKGLNVSHLLSKKKGVRF